MFADERKKAEDSSSNRSKNDLVFPQLRAPYIPFSSVCLAWRPCTAADTGKSPPPFVAAAAAALLQCDGQASARRPTARPPLQKDPL
jgi:hypothetical protein